jgi:hypothetical protein
VARVYVALFLLGLVFAVLALISCLSAEEGEVRGLPRLLWVLVILLFPLLGSIAYFFAGRPVSRAAKAGRVRPARRVIAPDDDPEFLRRIGGSHPPNHKPRPEPGKPEDAPDDG